MARRKDIHEFSFARARRAARLSRMDAEQKRQWMQEQLQGTEYARSAMGLVGG
jgi:hypothetical protein